MRRKPLGPRLRGDDRGRVRCAKSRAVGFSLLEVLVAFVILALVATALFRLYSGALNNVAAASDYSRAVLVAESVLAEAASAQPLREGSRTGNADEGRIAWTTRVERYVPKDIAPELAQAAESMPSQLMRVAVDVRFASPAGGERTLSLATVRIATRDLL